MQKEKWKELLKVEYRGIEKENKPQVEEGDQGSWQSCYAGLGPNRGW